MIRELDSHSYATLRAHSTWFPSSTTMIPRQFCIFFQVLFRVVYAPVQRYSPNWVHPMLPHYTGCQNTFFYARGLQKFSFRLVTRQRYKKIQQYLYLKATDRKEFTIELLSDQRFRVRRSLCVHCTRSCLYSIVGDCCDRVNEKGNNLLDTYCCRISETERPIRKYKA